MARKTSPAFENLEIIAEEVSITITADTPLLNTTSASMGQVADSRRSSRPAGTAYYTKMAPELFANDFFANATRTPRPDFSYNRYRTFFMWGYEGIHESRPRNIIRSPGA